MFSLTRTFKSKDGFQITPILMKETLIFLCQELESQLGYSNLSNSIRTSDGFREGTDYVVLTNGQLDELRDVLRVGSTHPQISPMIRSLTVITESGFWGLTFRSNKSECVDLRLWVTSEVLPSLRKTGKYDITTEKRPLAIVSDELIAAKIIAANCGLEDKNQIILAANKAVKNAHGIEPLKLLGLQLENEVQEVDYTPTELAAICGIKNAVEMNKELEKIGLQEATRTNKKLIWSPTKRAKEEKFCHLIDTGKKHSDGSSIIQVKWYRKTIDTIKESR